MLYIGRVCKYGDQPRANSRNNPAGQIIARGRNISARAEALAPKISLSLSLLARENAHLLTFYNSMLIKSSNIVLRAHDNKPRIELSRTRPIRSLSSNLPGLSNSKSLSYCSARLPFLEFETR